MSRFLRSFAPIKTPSSIRLSSTFRSQPSPPKLPAEQQAEFERLQRAAAVSSAFQPQAEQQPAGAGAASATTPATSQLRHETKPEPADVNQGLFRGAPPEFEGDTNPKTGEVGGPKNEPLRWGHQGDWSYNGRVCTWVSQAVLNLLPADLPDVVPGGEIIREPGMGVFCDNAMDLVMDLWPKPGPEVKALHVKSAMQKLNEVGLVGMHDAGATPGNLVLYSELADTDDWTLRVYSMLECDQRNTYCPDEAIKFSRDDHRFSVRSVKLFADGALGSWGSAMIEPYTDHPWTSGSMLINASALTDVTKRWAADGYQVNIHAIGDLANRNAIDALKAALAQQCPEDAAKLVQGEGGQDGDHPLAGCQDRHRFRIEHSQIIHPDDQRRIHSLGIIPSIQPTHATSDMKYALDRLGERRLADSAYRMRSLLPARPVLGSDFPVEPPNPFHGIYAAVARRSPTTGRGADGGSDGWYTDEVLSLDEALWGFTGAPAHGAFLDGRAGVIKEGALADWVLLDQPIESLGVEDLRALTVKETWVAGKRVHSRSG